MNQIVLLCIILQELKKLGQEPYILNNLGTLYVTRKQFEKAVIIFQIW